MPVIRLEAPSGMIVDMDEDQARWMLRIVFHLIYDTGSVEAQKDAYQLFDAAYFRCYHPVVFGLISGNRLFQLGLASQGLDETILTPEVCALVHELNSLLCTEQYVQRSDLLEKVRQACNSLLSKQWPVDIAKSKADRIWESILKYNHAQVLK